MLSNEQKAILKRAQREALIEDEEYRDILENQLGFGFRSSTDPRMGDRHMDKAMSFFEAIYWREVDSGAITIRHPKTVFSQRGYWQKRNGAGSNSRERYAANGLAEQINTLEANMRHLGKNDYYLAAIRRNCQTDWGYKMALERAVKANQAKQAEAHPF